MARKISELQDYANIKVELTGSEKLLLTDTIENDNYTITVDSLKDYYNMVNVVGADNLVVMNETTYNNLQTKDPTTIYFIKDSESSTIQSVRKIIALTQSEYNALTPDPQILYFIKDE